MSIDPKKFGLSDSLVNAVNEALKGGQTKLDKNHNGKLDSQDFKMLRKEDSKQQDAVDEQSPGDYEKANFKHGMLGTDKKMKNEVADGNKANFKQNMKEDDNKPATKIVAKPQYDKTRPAFTEPKKKVNEATEQIDELSPATLSSYKAKAAGSEKAMTDKSSTLSVPAKDRNAAAVKANQRRVGMKLATKKIGEEVVDEAAVAGTNVAADMDARKTEIQRRIAAKQASMQLAKSNKRISGSPSMKEAKCTCGEGKGSKMSCEVCNSDKKGLKGGKEPIIMNPPLKEAAVQVYETSAMKAIRTAVKRQTNAYGDAIKRGDDLSDKEKHKVDRSQALIKKKYGEKGDKIVYKAVGKRIGYQD